MQAITQSLRINQRNDTKNMIINRNSRLHIDHFVVSFIARNKYADDRKRTLYYQVCIEQRPFFSASGSNINKLCDDENRSCLKQINHSANCLVLQPFLFEMSPEKGILTACRRFPFHKKVTIFFDIGPHVEIFRGRNIDIWICIVICIF